MRVVLPEPVSLHIYRYGFFEAELTTMLLQCVRPGDTFYDVGAHFGYYSLLASELVGSGGRVVSFEPTPSTYAVLAENLSRTKNALQVPSAVSDRRGTVRLSDFGVRFSAFNSVLAPRLGERVRRTIRAQVHDVPSWSLDEYVASHGPAPSFVKIDAESAELAILRGMRQVLRENQPLVTLEVGDMDIPGAPTGRELVDVMTSHDYVAYEFRDGHIVRHEPRSRYGFANLLFAPVGVSPGSNGKR